ncbi:MAG: SDR family oxidoreductase [Bacteroidota bacterium]
MKPLPFDHEHFNQMNFILTGTSRGIGYDTALELAAYPEHQILAISRNEARLQTLVDTAAERYGHRNLSYLAADLTQLDRTALLAAIEPLGQIHGLVNNAGLLINKPFEDLTAADWQRLFATNLFGVVELLQTIAPYLVQAHILNIGSMGGFQGSSKFPGLSAYSASKAALANLTECLAEEWKDRGHRVNCLALGAVQTEMLTAAFPGFEAPVSSAEMGAQVVWFLLNGHRIFNGKVLPVSVSTP